MTQQKKPVVYFIILEVLIHEYIFSVKFLADFLSRHLFPGGVASFI